MSKFDLIKANINKKNPKNLTDKSVNNLDNLKANTIILNESLQTYEQNSKKDIKIQSKNIKVTKLHNDLNILYKQHILFKESL